MINRWSGLCRRPDPPVRRRPATDLSKVMRQASDGWWFIAEGRHRVWKWTTLGAPAPPRRTGRSAGLGHRGVVSRAWLFGGRFRLCGEDVVGPQPVGGAGAADDRFVLGSTVGEALGRPAASARDEQFLPCVRAVVDERQVCAESVDLGRAEVQVRPSPHGVPAAAPQLLGGLVAPGQHGPLGAGRPVAGDPGARDAGHGSAA